MFPMPAQEVSRRASASFRANTKRRTSAVLDGHEGVFNECCIACDEASMCPPLRMPAQSVTQP